ncbi:hypothetical protein BDN70DRAFT_939997 [Pholiota conissans]|uniref:Uncharacterized protein n=1 Tax=Pholiota conissans TaxID=109636 RepID=A0A9P6CL12_9AGAR|nr:hypothetical protein BDN70DRAFT_939997 [Pholiota conissans]
MPDHTALRIIGTTLAESLSLRSPSGADLLHLRVITDLPASLSLSSTFPFDALLTLSSHLCIYNALYTSSHSRPTTTSAAAAVSLRTGSNPPAQYSTRRGPLYPSLRSNESPLISLHVLILAMIILERSYQPKVADLIVGGPMSPSPCCRAALLSMQHQFLSRLPSLPPHSPSRMTISSLGAVAYLVALLVCVPILQLVLHCTYPPSQAQHHTRHGPFHPYLRSNKLFLVSLPMSTVAMIF